MCLGFLDLVTPCKGTHAFSRLHNPLLVIPVLKILQLAIAARGSYVQVSRKPSYLTHVLWNGFMRRVTRSRGQHRYLNRQAPSDKCYLTRQGKVGVKCMCEHPPWTHAILGVARNFDVSDWKERMAKETFGGPVD